jgi:hypothetical protein
MKYGFIVVFALLSLSFCPFKAQETTNLREPSQELLNASRLPELTAETVLEPSEFPRQISPQDIALTTGNVLFHFTTARFQLAETGPQHVDFILEGYIANYSNASISVFDGDFQLITDGQQIIANTDVMARLRTEYGESRDYPGRNILLLPQLSVASRQVRMIFVAFRIPANSRDAYLQLSYQNGNQSRMHLLLVPDDEDGTSPVQLYKMQVDNVAQYTVMEVIEGESSEFGAMTNIVDPFRHENCSRDPITITYDSYSSRDVKRLREFQLSISPETVSTRFLTIFGLVIFSEHVEERLFELNYHTLESSEEMVSQAVQSTTTVRALSVFYYLVQEQSMRRVNIFRVQHGTEVLEFPYTVEYSEVRVSSNQDELTTDYCG